jgi:hypothetical protein
MVRQGKDTVAIKCIHIHPKRASEVEAGDIIRSPRDGGHLPFGAWAQVMGVEVEDIVTKVTTLRPGTTDGVITDRRGERMDDPVPGAVRVQQAGTTVPSWELVEVQIKITAQGMAR